MFAFMHRKTSENNSYLSNDSIEKRITQIKLRYIHNMTVFIQKG